MKNELIGATQRHLIDLLGADEATAAASLVSLTEVEWHALTDVAVQQQLGALAFAKLRHLLQKIDVAPSALAILEGQYLLTALKNMEMYRKARQVFSELRRREVDPLVLKGLHLIATVYGDLALRPMSDLDILVRKSHLDVTEDLLRHLGFLQHANVQWMDQHHYHHHFFLPDESLRIEVHWNIAAAPFTIDAESLWERAQGLTIAGIPLQGLSDVDLLLYLCLHTAHHHLFNYFGLRSLYDIAELLHMRGDCIQWDEVVSRAEEWGVTNCVTLTLHLARQLLNAPVPPAALSQLRIDDIEPHVVEWAEEQVFAGTHIDEIPTAVAALVSDFLPVWQADTPRDKWHALLRTMVPPTQQMTTLYELSTGPADLAKYRLLHIKHLLRNNASVVAKLLRRDPVTTQWFKWETRTIAVETWIRPDRSHNPNRHLIRRSLDPLQAPDLAQNREGTREVVHVGRSHEAEHLSPSQNASHRQDA